MQEDKIDRGKVSDPEKNMLSCPLWHISIKCLHVIKAVVLHITTLMCELLSKLLHLVHECLQSQIDQELMAGQMQWIGSCGQHLVVWENSKPLGMAINA